MHIVHGCVQQGNVSGVPVSHENIGNPVSGTRGNAGNPNIDGAHPGARGAQFTGKLIHDHPPNPHLSQSKNSCIIDSISAVALSLNQSVIDRSDVFIDVLKSDLFAVVIGVVNSLYDFVSSALVIFSMLSGILFLSVSVSFHLRSSGISAFANVREPRVYSRDPGHDLQRSRSAPHETEALNPTSPYWSSPDSHHSSRDTIISP